LPIVWASLGDSRGPSLIMKAPLPEDRDRSIALL